ncbi:hypothetical protein BKA70DRAFT_1290854 [Coprinopsis sp. MPI-PUGE-AT-0042]|nr:hypothetical protein BKA70DRAFT_1290854 [Coprinopsis sp. MPI-PUGE-AT-0042]
MLSLASLTRFTLTGGWFIFKRLGSVDEAVHEAAVVVARCIGDIVGGPMLRALAVIGRGPPLPLLALCRPTLKELYASSFPHRLPFEDSLVLERQAPIYLEVLRLHENTTVWMKNGRMSLGHYLLDSRTRFNLGSLKHLEVNEHECFNRTLSRLLGACIGSLEHLSLSFKAMPSQDFKLNLWNASKMKTLFLHAQSVLDDEKMANFMQWLLRELDEQSHELLRNGSGNKTSGLTSVCLHLRVDFVTDMDPIDAAALSEVLSNHHRFPLLKEVELRLMPHPGPPSAERAVAMHREEIASAMHALKEKGVLRLRSE